MDLPAGTETESSCTDSISALGKGETGFCKWTIHWIEESKMSQKEYSEKRRLTGISGFVYGDSSVMYWDGIIWGWRRLMRVREGEDDEQIVIRDWRKHWFVWDVWKCYLVISRNERNARLIEEIDESGSIDYDDLLNHLRILLEQSSPHDTIGTWKDTVGMG